MSLDLQTNPVNEILHVAFNQDFSCFACGTETGFRVYNTDPFRLTWSRDFEPGGGLGVVAMLYRTNILAFVGGGKRPRLQPHKVVLWDDRQAQTIAELTFRLPVRAIRLRRELVVVVLSNKVYVYGLRSLILLDQVETSNNPKGLCCLSVGTDRVVLVCPGTPQGRASVIFYPKTFGEAEAPVARERTNVIAAHESPLASMAIDANGTMLATASDKGTIVRLFDTETGSRRQELRRGADRAEIHSLVFSPSGEYMAVSSDKGTIHIFVVGRPGPVAQGGEGPDGGSSSSTAGGYNATSSLGRISRVLPAYFSSEWSFAQLRVTDYRCIAAFGSDPHTVVAICANGSYYKARFDPARGGEMVREELVKFDQASLEEDASKSVAPSQASLSIPSAATAIASALPEEQPGSQGPVAAPAAATALAASASTADGAIDGGTGGPSEARSESGNFDA